MKTLHRFVPPNPDSANTETPDFLMFGIVMYEADTRQTDLARIEHSFASLSEDDREWIKQVHAKLEIENNLADSVADGVNVNAIFFSRLVRESLESVFPAPLPLTENPSAESLGVLSARVRSLPLVAAREWSSFLAHERELTHKPLREAVLKYCTPTHGPVLVPGSSAGRLVFDIAELGFEVVGIEHDPLRVTLMHSIICGNGSTICPYILDTCNRMSMKDNQFLVKIPDVTVDSAVLSRITIDANEFFESIANYPAEEFSSVVTSWFIDSQNVDMEKFIMAIKRVLKPNGLWINLGPLDFGYLAEKEVVWKIGNPKRSVDEIRSLVESSGFEITEQSEIESTYLGNPKTIMETRLACCFFVARLVC